MAALQNHMSWGSIWAFNRSAGPRSILTADGRPCGVRRAGVRCFDSGVGNETEIAAAKTNRRTSSGGRRALQRRQLWRRGKAAEESVSTSSEGRASAPRRSPQTPGTTSRVAQEAGRGTGKTYLPERDRDCRHLLALSSPRLALDQPLPPFALAGR